MAARKSRRAVAMLVAVAMCGSPGAVSSARAGTMTGGSTEWTQISNNIQLVMGLIQQIMQLRQIVQQVKMMKKMTDGESKFLVGMQIFENFNAVMLSSAQLAFAGVSMASQWRKSHPGDATPEVAGYGSVDEAYRAMDKDMHTAAEGALKTLDVQVSDKAIAQDRQILDQLRNKMDTAAGQLQATKASNEILLEVVRQLNLMRQLLQVTARMTTIGLSEEAQRRLYEGATVRKEYTYTGKYRGIAP